MANLTKPERKKLMERYRSDPLSFQVECLDLKREHIWDKMEEVALSVRDHKFTAVKAGHGVSKTFEAARIALWFLMCHKPSTVVTTAPTHTQVEEVLWREIRSAWSNKQVPLPVVPTKTKLDLGEKWFALGFSTRADTITQEATNFQGYHNEHVLVIFDEAAGIASEIWRASRYILTEGHCRMLAIGNPTTDVGDFADCFKVNSGWNQITISVKDTPNFKKGRSVIPGVSGKSFEKEIRDKFGTDSNEYRIRILGEIPEFTEGTFYGSRIAKAEKDGRVRSLPFEQTEPVHVASDMGNMHSRFIFFQLIRDWIHIIDYFIDDTGIGVPGFCKMLTGKPYNYGRHFTGPDYNSSSGSNKKSIGTGTVVLNEFSRLGIHVEPVRTHSFIDRISTTKDIFNKFVFNKDLCGELIEDLKRYRMKKNPHASTDDKIVYYKEVDKNGSDHAADALGHLAIAYRFMITDIGGQLIGLPNPVRSYRKRKKFNVLNWRRGA